MDKNELLGKELKKISFSCSTVNRKKNYCLLKLTISSSSKYILDCFVFFLWTRIGDVNIYASAFDLQKELGLIWWFLETSIMFSKLFQ